MDNIDDIDELINFADRLLEIDPQPISQGEGLIAQMTSVSNNFDLMDANSVIEELASLRISPVVTDDAITASAMVTASELIVVDEEVKKTKESEVDLYFKKLTDIAKTIFGDNKVSFEDKPCKQLVIWFPRITIKNSAKQKHTIRDLYVRFRFRDNGQVYETLEGARSTYTFYEHKNNYSHSHLPSAAAINAKYENFCLGYDSFRISIDSFKKDSTVISTFNYDKFELMLYELGEYVKWESAEGGPYNYMTSALSYGNQNTIPRLNESQLQYLTEAILTKLPKIPISTQSVNLVGERVVIVSEAFNNVINSLFKHDLDLYNYFKIQLVDTFNSANFDNIFAYYQNNTYTNILSNNLYNTDITDALLTLKERNNTFSLDDAYKIYFNGKKIDLRVLKVPQSNEINYAALVIKPKLLSNVEHLINEKLNLIYD